MWGEEVREERVWLALPRDFQLHHFGKGGRRGEVEEGGGGGRVRTSLSGCLHVPLPLTLFRHVDAACCAPAASPARGRGKTAEACMGID